DDPSRNREPESKWIAEGEHRLSRSQSSGVAPWNTRQIRAVHFDDSQIRQWIRPHEPGIQDSPVTHRDTNIHRAVYHMVIGHDIAIGRYDNAAPDTVFDTGLLRRHAMTEELTKELLHVLRLLAVRELAISLRRYGHVHDRRRHSRRQGFHCLVQS